MKKQTRNRTPETVEGFFLKTGKKGDVLYSPKRYNQLTAMAACHKRKVKVSNSALLTGNLNNLTNLELTSIHKIIILA